MTTPTENNPTFGTTLGLDLSTQSLSAVLLDTANGAIVWKHSLSYRDDPRLAGFGFEHETLIIPPREVGEAEQPPKLFIAALEALFSDLVATGIDVSRIGAINASGQQHGHVYLAATAKQAFAALHQPESERLPLLAALKDAFAYGGAPIWKTANTAEEVRSICAAIGDKKTMIERTGSAMPLRFAAPVHRKLGMRYPDRYDATWRVMQLSSFLPAILAGDAEIPLDFGNACGTGLMNYQRRDWDQTLIAATADGLPGGAAALQKKLPPIAHPLTAVGKVASYFQRQYGLSPDCKIIIGSGDNPQSKVLAQGDLLSLGTSFVYMVATPDGSVDQEGAANAMYDGLGKPFNFVCRTNGALVWDRLRSQYGLGIKDYAACEAALREIAPGKAMRFWHPDAESFPVINANPEIVRFDDGPVDFKNDFSALVDSTLGLMYLYGMKIHQDTAGRKNPGDHAGKLMPVCGGAAANKEIMRRIAAIWNCPVIESMEAGAALGAATAAAVAIISASIPDARKNECEGEVDKLLDRLRANLVGQKMPTEPDPALVSAYHAPNAYLDQLEKVFERLRS